MRCEWMAVSLAIAGGCGRLGFGDAPPADADCAVTISPSPARVNLNSRVTFAADGGVPDYLYSLTDGGGATIDPATGELQAGPDPAVPTVEVADAAGCRATADVVVGGDTLWFAGGSTAAVPSKEVWRTTNGIDWILAGQLPQRRMYGALVTFRDQLLYIAGSDGSPIATIYASPDGATWSTLPPLPMPSSNFGFAVHDGKLFVVGGNGNADNVYASSDGSTWNLVGHLPDLNHGGSLVSLEGKLWYVGGHNGNLYDWVLSSADGVSWTMEGTIPLAREYHSSLVISGAIMIAGGQDTTPTKLGDISTSTTGTSWTSIAPERPFRIREPSPRRRWTASTPRSNATP